MPKHSKSLSRHFAEEHTEARLGNLSMNPSLTSKPLPQSAKGKKGKTPGFALRETSAAGPPHAAKLQEVKDQKVELSQRFGGSVPAAILDAVLDSSMTTDLDSAISALVEMGFQLQSSEPSQPSNSDITTGVDLWDYLPVDLQLKIWDLLPIKDACRAAATCKSFQSNSRTQLLKLKVLRLPPGLSFSAMEALVMACPNAQTLCATNFLQKRQTENGMANTTFLGNVIDRASNIKTLDLRGCELANLANRENLFKGRSANLSGCSSLTTCKIWLDGAECPPGRLFDLNIAKCPLVPGSDIAVHTRGAMANKMTKIDFSYNPNVEDKHIVLSPNSTLCEMRGSHCKRLTKLQLGLPQVHPLEHLNFSGCENLTQVNVVAASLKTLNLSHCPNLKELALKTKKLEKLVLTLCSKLEEVAEDTQLKRVQELNVDGCSSLNSTSLHRVLDQSEELQRLRASGCTSLEFLRLEKQGDLCQLDVSGCRNLQALICTSTNLKDIKKQNCGLLHIYEVESQNR